MNTAETPVNSLGTMDLAERMLLVVERLAKDENVFLHYFADMNAAVDAFAVSDYEKCVSRCAAVRNIIFTKVVNRKGTVAEMLNEKERIELNYVNLLNMTKEQLVQLVPPISPWLPERSSL